MKLSTLNSKLRLLSVGTNAKTRKGDDAEKLTAIMYLAPSDISGYEVCPDKNSCASVCLYTAGRGAMNSVQQARVRKTKLFFEQQAVFLDYLKEDLTLFSEYCLQENVQGYVRLNGTSDIPWEKYLDMTIYKSIHFYDYTKTVSRALRKQNDNYKLTFSRDETTTDDVLQTLLTVTNVSIVFDKVPFTYSIGGVEYPVIEGDLTDLRFDDPAGVIIGLKAKGLAKNDTSGFVVKIPTIQI